MDSFVNFFQLQNFHLFPYFSFISQRIWYKGGGGGFRKLGPGGDSLLEGATCRGSVDLGSVCSFKKNNLTQLMHSFSKRSIHSEETISTC